MLCVGCDICVVGTVCVVCVCGMCTCGMSVVCLWCVCEKYVGDLSSCQHVNDHTFFFSQSSINGEQRKSIGEK